jgi:hypothetical protein
MYCTNHLQILKKLFAQIANRRTARNCFLLSARLWEVLQALAVLLAQMEAAVFLLMEADALRVCAG